MTEPTTRAPERVPVRDALVDVTPYGAPQLDVPVRLNTNETAEPPPAGYLEEVGRRIQGLELNRYPDRPHRALRQALASRLALTPEQVWAANGSNEILLQLLQAYGGPGRKAMHFAPGYSMYPELCRTAMTDDVVVELTDAFELPADLAAEAVATNDPDVVLVPSPNNPVGNAVAPEAIRALHDGSRALIIVDEAYVEFDPEVSVLKLLGELPRLVVVRTFSKAFRLAGLRLGYLAAAAWVVEDVQKVRLPYHLDAIKQVAALVALEHEDEFLEHRARVAAERTRLAEALSARGDVEVFASSANFLLLRSQADNLFKRLLEQGVLVRDFSSRHRLAGCVRVTVGTEEENNAFLNALDTVMSAGA